MSEDSVNIHGCDEITERKFQELKMTSALEVVSMTDEDNQV